MAVNTIEISKLFKSLISDVRDVLKDELTAERITKDNLAKALESTLNTAMQLSVQSVQNQPLVDAQVAGQEAQTSSIQNSDSIASAQSAKDLAIKDAQKALIDKQATTEDKRALLTDRQKIAYDDNLRVEEAKSLANIMGMFGGGGTALPSGLETTTLDAIDRITP